MPPLESVTACKFLSAGFSLILLLRKSPHSCKIPSMAPWGLSTDFQWCSGQQTMRAVLQGFPISGLWGVLWIITLLWKPSFFLFTAGAMFPLFEFVDRKEGSFSFVGDLTHRTPMGNTDSKLCLSAYLVRPLLSTIKNEQKSPKQQSWVQTISKLQHEVHAWWLRQVGRRYTRRAAGWLQADKTHEVIRFGRKRNKKYLRFFF